MYQDIDSIKKKNFSDINENCIKQSSVLVKDEKLCKIIKQKKTILQEFYSNQCIFITGGTGFLGKILIEKLLRCCPDISKIYILLRPKKEKNFNTRLNELFNNTIFDQVKKIMPDFMEKIIGIPGDCSLSHLGLNLHDSKLLIDDVTIVFHVAATVRFNEELIKAVEVNLKGVNEINDICQKMKKLKAIVHVSTLYAHCSFDCIEEKFYDYKFRGEEFLNFINSSSIDDTQKIYSELMSSWPNTYTFTKALAEDLIRTKSKNLPIGIFRPGIVISAAEEPLPGWVDNFNGPIGLSIALISGFMRVLHCNESVITTLIPVDFTVNAIIASAWDIFTNINKRNEKMLIYNYTSTVDAPITWGKFRNELIKGTNKYPFKTALWITNTKFCNYKLIAWLYRFCLHWIPAIIADFILFSIGKKRRFITLYKKLHKNTNAMSYFCTREWMFTNDNVKSLWQQLKFQDKQMFPFFMNNFNWNEYIDKYVKGIRIYLLKDDLKTLEYSKIKQKRLYWLDQLVHIILYVLGCWLLWNILSTILKNDLLNKFHQNSYTKQIFGPLEN